MSNSLKAKNLKFIITTLLLDIAIFMTTPLGDKVNFLQQHSIPYAWLLNKIGNGTIAVITALLINYLLTPNTKNTIVFWKLRDALPACRAFSKLIHHDPRIDVDILKSKINPFPISAKEQNTLWYQLFKKHESKVEIENAHQFFLLFRDITSMTALLLPVMLLVVLFDISNYSAYKYQFLLLFCQYILCMVCTRNAGNRFVQNVLALECISQPQRKNPKK